MGTNFGTQIYTNPAKTGKLIIVSTEMVKGTAFDFIGRDKVDAYTQWGRSFFLY